MLKQAVNRYNTGESPQVGDVVRRSRENLSIMWNGSEAELTVEYLSLDHERIGHGDTYRFDLVRRATPPPVATKPNYYRFVVRGVELDVTDVIQALDLGFEAGNVYKYLARAGRKSATTEIDDLKKAREYIDRLIQRRESV